MSESDVKAVVRQYVQAMTFADETGIHAAFHPDASIVGNYDGELEWLSVDEFIGQIKSVGGASEGTEPVLVFLSVDITEDAASTKVENEFAGMRFTDYLSLLKIGKDWKIVGKIYHLHK